MKKAYLFLLPLVLGLAACNPQTDTSTSVSGDVTSEVSQPSSGSQTSSSTSKPNEKKIKVYFFTSYDYFDKETAHAVQEVVYGGKLTKPTNPTCPDEAYPTFLGWSERPVVDQDRFIIDFSTYTVTKDTTVKELYIYGIWVA